MPHPVLPLLGAAFSQHELLSVLEHQQVWVLEQLLSLICTSCMNVEGEQFEQVLCVALS